MTMNIIETRTHPLTKHIDCPHCQGEGHVMTIGRMNFSQRFEVFEETESFVCCNACNGEGVLEVCEICLAPFRIEHGEEVCGCEAVRLPKAA